MLCISVLLVAIDNTIVNVALPARRRTLFFVGCVSWPPGHTARSVRK